MTMIEKIAVESKVCSFFFVAVGMALFVSACATTGTSTANQKTLKSELHELKNDIRRDKTIIRDLRNEIFVLRDRLQTAITERDRVQQAVPELPVEVMEPQPEAPKEVAIASRSTDPGYQYVGVDDEGAEIIYIGDAAKDESTTIHIPKEKGKRIARRYRERRSRSSASTVSMVNDTLPFSRGKTNTIPKVGTWVKRNPSVAPQSSSQVVTNSEGARDEYRKYLALLRNGKHEESRQGFMIFLKKYSYHDYADNAQYWLGESYYDQKKYAKALREFRKVVEVHPKGNKVPDAMLKMAYCYDSMGDRGKASRVLRQVVAVFPKSHPALLAAKRLKDFRVQ